jgi:cytochrome P450
MAGIMVDSTSRMLQRWEGNASRAEAVDGRAEVILLTLEILLRNMFSGDLMGSEQVIRDAILDCSRHMDLIGAVKLVKVLTWFRFAKRRRFERAVRTLDQFVLRVVEERRRNQVDNGDLVSLLLWARDEQTGESMSDRQIRDELKTMLQAGNDTVADVICWTWYLLAKHPEVRERVELEVDAALKGRSPGFEDLPALEYTRRVIMEVMRLYPPGWVFARSAVKDDVIGGYRIPAEALVIISPYVMHRLPGLWEDPEKFDPYRFLPEKSQGRPRFAYFPFSAGPRQCIGADIAMMEAQMIVAMAAQRYRLSVPADFSPGLKARISLTADCAIALTPVARQPHLVTQVPSGTV